MRIEERLETVRALRDAGIETYATLAPLLPCDPEALARAALEATGRDLIGDPLHVRAVKPQRRDDARGGVEDQCGARS